MQMDGSGKFYSQRHAGIRHLSLGSVGGRGELIFGPAHLLVRAVPVLLDWAGADEHISAATRRKIGAECHSGPELAAAKSQPSTTHRSNRFKTLIPHLTETHSTIMFLFSQPLLGAES